MTFVERIHRSPRLVLLTTSLVCATVLAGCASTVAFRQGETAALNEDWDAAVDFYRQAVQDDPSDPSYRIELERAMQNAARVHVALARELESRDELPAALAEYRRAMKYGPTNGQVIATVSALERRLRDLVEASRPPSPVEQLREQVRLREEQPLLDPASDDPLAIQFSNAGLRDILDFVGSAAGINVTYDQQFQDRAYTVRLEGVTLEQALDQILTANQAFYKVLNPRSLIVVPDTPQKRAQYEEQVIRTFFVSHADVTELATLLTQVVRAPTLAVQPQIVPNATSNTITIRATTAVADVISQVISANDKPRAEIVVDVEILEVNRERARQFGLDLTQYSIGSLFSPSSAPAAGTGPTGLTGSTFNANLLSQGVSASDFYLAVPAAIIDFLETDSETRLIANPQLRGQEGAELTLNLGDDIPVPSTSFTPIATGGVAVNPLTSFEYRAVGVNLIMTPRVTYDNEIILDLEVENSTLGANIVVAGQPLPTFGTRRVITRLRLQDGESNLLAGLLREEDRRSLRGFPGILHLPIIKQLFSANDTSVSSTDIIMLLTPRIVRTHELTEDDLSPIYIGTQQNMGVTGPPPLIAPSPEQTQGDGTGPQENAAASTPPATGLPVDSAPAATPFPGSAPSPVAASNTTEPVLGPDRSDAVAGTQVTIVPPAMAELALTGGAYTVPIAITGATQLSTLSLSLRFDPDLLSVSTVQEGSFMQQGSAYVTFEQDLDSETGRIDLAFTRTGDRSGAAGSGLVASIVFEPVAQGAATLSPSGIALTPSGAPIALNFAPTTVRVR